MIRHVVLFTARSPEDRERVGAGLSLLARIAHAARLEIAENMRSDPFDRAVDFVVYAEFDSEADLDAYRRDPLYEEAIRLVRPIRDLRMAADFGPADVLIAARRGRVEERTTLLRAYPAATADGQGEGSQERLQANGSEER